MGSQLHARKKTVVACSHEEHGDAELGHTHQHHHHHHARPASPETASTTITRRRSRPRNRRELRWAFSSVCSFLAGGLLLAYLLLHHRHRRVIFHVLRDPVGHGRGILHGRVGFRHHFYSGAPRYITVVMPSVVAPDARPRRLDAIFRTWATGARALYVVHDGAEFPRAAHAVWGPEGHRPEDPYSYPQLLQLPPEISVEHGLPRLLYTMRTVVEQINPDFAFFVNDHTFVLPAHVCAYLEAKNPDETLYAGRALGNDKGVLFNSGAAGYMLSRETMRQLLETWEKDPACAPSADDKWLQNNPGLATAKCLASLNIKPVDTRDGQSHRFHAYPLTREVTGNVDEWYTQKTKNVEDASIFSSPYNVQHGPDCCARDTVTFHYVEWKETLALMAIREELLKNPLVSDHELKKLMHLEWPHARDEIGFYSRGLPTVEEDWKPLLDTMRKISGRDTQRDC